MGVWSRCAQVESKCSLIGAALRNLRYHTAIDTPDLEARRKNERAGAPLAFPLPPSFWDGGVVHKSTVLCRGLRGGANGGIYTRDAWPREVARGPRLLCGVVLGHCGSISGLGPKCTANWARSVVQSFRPAVYTGIAPLIAAVASSASRDSVFTRTLTIPLFHHADRGVVTGRN